MSKILCLFGLHQYGANRHQTVHNQEVTVIENCVDCAKEHIASYWRIQYEPARKISNKRSIHRPTRPAGNTRLGLVH